MEPTFERALSKKENIQKAGLTIYDPVETGDKDYWYTSEELMAILDVELGGISLAGLPLRTRSKFVKTSVCEVLGYPVPKSFKRVQPRFSGQNFDIYIQKSNNLQIWNEELGPKRRYVLIRVSKNDLITRVKVVTGVDLAHLDTTGKLTRKFQARLIVKEGESELISKMDTDPIQNILSKDKKMHWSFDTLPNDAPKTENLLSIAEIYDKLEGIVGKSFKDSGHDQERNRGAELHRLICKELGYIEYHDDGRFPDIKNQLLEIKLQTSTTIDLGLVSPDSEDFLDLEEVSGEKIRYCDVRYAIFYGITNKENVEIRNFILLTGKDFFSRFQQFGGNVLNKKLQMRLPENFFESNE